MPSYKVKCLVLGDARIDTWGILAHYIHGFNDRYKNTIGCDIGVVDIQMPWEHVILSIWDVACKERFRFFRQTFYRGAQCALLFFDLTRSDSFNPTLNNLIREIYSSQGTIPLILIGCNADKIDQRQITPEAIDELRTGMGATIYFELGLNPDIIPEIFERVAEFSLNDIGLSEEKRQNIFEMQQKRLENMTEILEQMGYLIKEHSEIEILNHHGLFSINLDRRHVYFTPLICGTCKRNQSCEANMPPHRASLCIISDGEGWSNIELPNDDLLLLAKIFAITEDRLPTHVLNQMCKVEKCAHYINENSSTFFDNSEYLVASEIEIPEAPLELTLPEIDALPQTVSENAYILKELFENICPSEAQTLLRNYRIQFSEGRMPYSLFEILKRKCEKILFS